MIIAYNQTATGQWIIEICDANLDVDFRDTSSWIVPGTIDSDYEVI